jgi:hypothetical protein
MISIIEGLEERIQHFDVFAASVLLQRKLHQLLVVPSFAV